MFQRELRVPIEKGVRQGDTISPKLFTTALNHAMLQQDWDGKGININGKKLFNLRFAGDIVLISQKREELQQMVEELDYVRYLHHASPPRTTTIIHC
uniref:Reverse transcriptase domain-containing protein n=1 Tax=Haemonchus contortus TaxID=6289 RepID=A0A7I4YD98_HAECO